LSSLDEVLVSFQLLGHKGVELARRAGVRGYEGAKRIEALPTLQNPVLEGVTERIVWICHLVVDHDDAA
jgi:hypothetical protein